MRTRWPKNGKLPWIHIGAASTDKLMRKSSDRKSKRSEMETVLQTSRYQHTRKSVRKILGAANRCPIVSFPSSGEIHVASLAVKTSVNFGINLHFVTATKLMKKKRNKLLDSQMSTNKTVIMINTQRQANNRLGIRHLQLHNDKRRLHHPSKN